MERMIKNMKHNVFTLLIAGMIGGVSACSNDKRDTETSSSTNTAKAYNESDAETMDNDAETMNTTESSWMKEMDQYVAEHIATIDKIDKEIEEREKEMEKMGSKSKSAMKESINSLKLKRDQFEDKLNNVSQATQSDWMEMKKDVDEKASELNLTYEAFDKQYGMHK